MLALADADGVVRASIGGLAHAARVTREDCAAALATLESPDPDSRSEEFEGRRIEKIDGGFRLLNFPKYREARSDEERKEYMRLYMQNYRKQHVSKRKQKVNSVSSGKPQLAQAEAEAGETSGTNGSDGDWISRIQQAYLDKASQNNTRFSISASMLKGHKPEDILAGTMEAVRLIQKNFPSGIKNKYVAKAESFFYKEMWEHPENHFDPKDDHANQTHQHRATGSLNSPGRYK